MVNQLCFSVYPQGWVHSKCSSAALSWFVPDTYLAVDTALLESLLSSLAALAAGVSLLLLLLFACWEGRTAF